MNELRKEYHNKTAGQIGEKARDLQTSYFTDEYVFWLEEQLKQLRIPVVSNTEGKFQAVEDLIEFARNNCREWNNDEMEEIIDRL